MGSRLFMALVHYPVYNRRQEVVATAITNLDIHDIARAARTYGVESVLIVTPSGATALAPGAHLEALAAGTRGQSAPQPK